jgi:hypothetical protein
VTKQGQRAGDHSQQLQAAGDIYVGVSAADVVKITRIEVSRALGELTESAKDKADIRISALADKVIEHFQDRPELFSAFADPDFQYSLRDAGRAAASNDDEHTEQLLVDLLSNRAEEGNSARVRLATSQALRAADKLSLDALNGVTAVWAISFLGAQTKSFENEVQSLKDIAGALVKLGLPADREWVRDVDVLNLARVHTGIISRTVYAQVVQAKVAADLVAGIDANEEGGPIASVKAAIPSIAEHILPHPLKPGFVRLSGANRDELLGGLPEGASENAELQQLIEKNAYGSQDADAVSRLGETVLGTGDIAMIAKWWDETPALDLTVVGDVVGFVNTRRYVAFGGATTVGELLRLRSK